MARSDVIDLMVFISSKKPNYFKRYTNDQKEDMIKQWIDKFQDHEYESIQSLVDSYIQTHNRVPYPQHIKALMPDAREEKIESLWYRFFPEEGDFYYTDKQMKEASDYVKEATNDKEWRIPDEMRKRMHYRRDPDDTDMNYLVNEIQSIQMLGFENEEAKQRLNKLIEMYTS